MAGRCRALLLGGDRKYKVQSVRHPLEEALTYTNDAVAGTTRELTTSEGVSGGNSRAVGP